VEAVGDGAKSRFKPWPHGVRLLYRFPQKGGKIEAMPAKIYANAAGIFAYRSDRFPQKGGKIEAMPAKIYANAAGIFAYRSVGFQCQLRELNVTHASTPANRSIFW
jgi:hypothetical protein